MQIVLKKILGFNISDINEQTGKCETQKQMCAVSPLIIFNFI